MRKKSPVEELLEGLAEKYTERYVTNRNFRIAIDVSYPTPILTSLFMDLRKKVSQRFYRRGARKIMTGYIMKLLMPYEAEINEANEDLIEHEDRTKSAVRAAENGEKRAKREGREMEQEKENIRKYIERRMENINRKKNEELEYKRKGYRQQAQEYFEQEFRKSLENARLISRGRYNRDDLVDKLSELFLDDILEKAGPDTRDGYKALLSGAFGVEFSGRGPMKPDVPPRAVDWVATKRASMESGRNHIEEEDVIVRYPQGEKEQIISAVVAMDVSISMRDERKLEIAKQTSLALGKMLENMNEENTIFYIVFAGGTKLVDAAELYQMGLYSATNIGGALTKAKNILDRSPDRIGLVYAITDCDLRGAGYDLGSVLVAAERYASHENYYLRLFFINPDGHTKSDAKQIAETAGKNSRLVPVNENNLDVRTIEDFVGLFTGIYKPEEIK